MLYKGSVMKWLFLFLLSINAVIFVYQEKGFGGRVVVMDYVSDSSAKGIGLLSEVKAGGAVDERCVVIGPVEGQESLERIKRLLDDWLVVYEIIDKKEEMAPSYWVFAEGNREEGLVDELASVGIDSYKVVDGKRAGEVSLGLFANIDLAENLIKRVKAKGFNAFYVEHERFSESRWLSFKVQETVGLSELKSRVEASKIKVGEIKEFFCKSVASEK